MRSLWVAIHTWSEVVHGLRALMRSKVAVLMVLIASAGLSIGGMWYVQSADARAAQSCERAFSDETQRRLCWYRVLQQRVRYQSVGSATNFVAYLYEHYPEFVRVGCHAHTHKLGDLTYFERYARNPSLDAIDFPQSTSACGFGFYHGFIEHVIQNHPDPVFVETTCADLFRRLGDTMRDIRKTCYHGAGHGFALAQIGAVEPGVMGNMQRFIVIPLKQCDALPAATPEERSRCRDGVFNVVMAWSVEGQYGFTYDKDNILAPCATVPSQWQSSCYAEYSQRIVVDQPEDIGPLWESLSGIKEKRRKLTVFGTAVAGAIQASMYNDSYVQYFPVCAHLPEEPAVRCISSLAHGMMEHGSPQQEYKKAMLGCELAGGAALRKECYGAIIDSLRRFYDEPTRRKICDEFPADMRDACVAEG